MTDQPTEASTRALLVELLGVFYQKGWVSGTGGGICGPADGGGLLLAPTGVHKERIQVDEFFTVDPHDGGRVLRTPANPDLRPSECNAIFSMTARERGATSVVHSHALSAVLAGDLAADGADHVEIRDLEMLKGIRGLGNRDVHLLPVIRNTPREAELTEQLQRVLGDPRFQSSFAVVVADHGAYIWGDDVWEAKRHTEVYHFLFEAVVARRDRSR